MDHADIAFCTPSALDAAVVASGVIRSFDHGWMPSTAGPLSCRHPYRSGPALTRSMRAGAVAGDMRQQPRGKVLPFPVRGEALLVQLADVLRRRVAGRQPDHNPLWLTSRDPRLRLSIDGVNLCGLLSEVSQLSRRDRSGARHKADMEPRTSTRCQFRRAVRQ